MSSNPSSRERVGVIGAGSFGTVFANLLAKNRDVILYARRPEEASRLQAERTYKSWALDPSVEVVNDPEYLSGECELIFPVVPSQSFRSMLRVFAPYLRPYHKMLHATKGLEITFREGQSLENLEKLRRDQVLTMSELITQETSVLRVGCVAGPNLAAEIADGQPAATVVASPFDEVITEGQQALRSNVFRVHANHDLIGIELAGVLKNIMAIGSGILDGLGYGFNTKAMLITRGLAEMVKIAKPLGAEVNAFLGLAGIGDLIATCSSPDSRNYTLGYRISKGLPPSEVIENMDETAEGVKTVAIVRALANNYRIPAPITLALYKILFQNYEIQKGIRLLMEFSYSEDGELI
ncbi:MAG: NAD(P)-dependent glycerol-3-phosphate dehydrogenase [Bacteroidia bacterium]|nr:NAD(P)-dependent glycerol-3-phosphate dehydrogenase [Bacteroidia bacterium]